MKITKTIFAKAATLGVLAAGLLIAAPTHADAQVRFGVSFGRPAYRAPVYVAPGYGYGYYGAPAYGGYYRYHPRYNRGGWYR